MSEDKLQKKPTISVVCATYNRAKMVRETVLAAWNQTLRPDEIVVSDDCSPDNTLEVLRELQKEVPILKIVESLKNSGGVPNWNQVIEASSGDIIAWCSDDDRFKEDHLEKSVRYLLEHEDIGLVHAGFEEVREAENGTQHVQYTSLKSDAPIIITRDNIVEYMTRHFSWYFHPSTLVFRRTLWNNTGIFNSKYALADTDWFIRAAMHHRLVYLPYFGVINRRHYSNSGNWSIRVGSINMQREFYEAIYSFADEASTLLDTSSKLDQQVSRWTLRYRLLILRIFIARCRAGNYLVATDCARELTRVTPFLLKIPSWLSSPFLRGIYFLLSRLQIILPGGRKKYRNLGKHVPM